MKKDATMSNPIHPLSRVVSREEAFSFLTSLGYRTAEPRHVSWKYFPSGKYEITAPAMVWAMWGGR